MSANNPYRALSDADAAVNYEEEEAREWRQQSSTSRSRRENRYDDGNSQYKDDSGGAKRTPDEVWLLPPNVRPVVILGERGDNLKRIQDSTNTHMIFNSKTSQIEMWGKRDDLKQALKQWNNLAENILENILAEEKSYRGFPPEHKPFYGIFLLPNTDIPTSIIVDENEKGAALDPIRVKTKCYIWNDINYIKVAGNTLESVEDATMRIKHIYIKASALRSIPQLKNEDDGKIEFKGWIYHLVEEPKFPYLVKISDKPSWLPAPYDTKDVKIFEPVIDGNPEELILNDKSKYDTSILEVVRNSNPIMIENALKQALGTVHLFDEKIKMRIRFGYVCLTDFPKEPLWNFERLHNKFKICATRAPLKRDDKTWGCSFDVQFKGGKDGKIGLWSAVTDEKKVMEINMICLDNDYSWRLAVEAARHLSNDKFSPQGIFVYKLRLSPQNRLIYTNTDKVQVTSICQKTKWKYWWGEHYVVEVTRYEYWKCSKFANISAGVEITMDKEEPVSVTYGVTFYKKSWDDDFAYNTALDIGEIPEWHPNDIIYDQKIGGIKGLIDEIRNFLDQLQHNIPAPRTSYY
ncbi:15037_t:CDS:10 [Entrophospora sp. SA101]|nr:15037_t:CDS:10 [Entrophospora sp. SA101]